MADHLHACGSIALVVRIAGKRKKNHKETMQSYYPTPTETQEHVMVCIEDPAPDNNGQKPTDTSAP